MRPKKKEPKESRKQGNVEVRPDLEDASKGKDLSYLSEMPQMGGYEGVKAGIPPPPVKKKTGNVDNNKENNET